MKFLVETTLGKLLKWLRIIGFDAIPEPRRDPTDDSTCDRIRLTRTRRKPALDNGGPLIFIESDHVIAQLRQVIHTLGVTREDIRPFSRCIQCNSPLISVDKDRIRTRVPDYVWHTADTFRQCPQCHKIFWPGSHTRNTLAVVRQLFAENPPA